MKNRRCLASITLPKLDKGKHSQPGSMAVVAGWGHLADAEGNNVLAGKFPDELHSVELTLFSNPACEARLSRNLPDSTLCAVGNLNGGAEDACQVAGRAECP